jgi:hypothetical protein
MKEPVSSFSWQQTRARILQINKYSDELAIETVQYLEFSKFCFQIVSRITNYLGPLNNNK